MLNFDAVIIGAGIVGAAAADSLSAEGLNIAVIDCKNHIAGAATASGMGHIVVMDDSPAQFALTAYSQQLWDARADELPKDSEFENCGTIWVAEDNEIEMEEVRRKHDHYTSLDIKTEILDEKELRKLEPNLRKGLGGGLLVKNDSVVYQLKAAEYFMKRAIARGAKLITGKRALSISSQGVRLNDRTIIQADNVINAAGVGAFGLDERLKIISKKGHLAITDRYHNFVSHQLIELGYLRSAHGTESDSVAFNVQPRSTGQILVGSSRQYGQENDDIDHNIVKKMINRAFDYMPALKDLSVLRVWTGFRPATPDNLPYIGRCPWFAGNVYAAAGHEGLGITTSLGCAQLLADEMIGRRSKIDRNPYSPKRIFE